MSDDPYSYGDYAYDQTPLVFPADTSGLPELDPAMIDFLSGFQYPTSSRGVDNPYNLQTQNLFQNAYQDRLQTLFDMGNAMLTGGLAPGAFAPDVQEKQLDFPVTGTLMMQAQGSGLESLLAQYTLDGLSPSQAMLRIRRAVEAAPDDDLEMQDLKAVLPRLPPNQYTPNVPGEIDWDNVTKLAAKLGDSYMQEQGIMARAGLPNSGVIERNGKFFQTTETPSAATQWLTSRGFDNPYTQYDADYVRNTNPEFGGIEQSLVDSFGALTSARDQYASNDAERKRQTELQRRFSGRDQEAMARFASGVQDAMGQYGSAINRDMLRTPEWGGTQVVSGEGQDARDARLREALMPFRNFGAEGAIGATPESARQALYDYMSGTSAQGLETIPGHPGRIQVGRAGASTPFELPELPQLSAYSPAGAADAGAAALATELLGRMPFTGRRGGDLRRKLEDAGRVKPKGVRPKQVDAALRSAAYDKTHAAQLAYAQAMLPAYLAAKAGRTPFQDQVRARAQSMYGVGAMG